MVAAKIQSGRFVNLVGYCSLSGRFQIFLIATLAEVRVHYPPDPFPTHAIDMASFREGDHMRVRTTVDEKLILGGLL